MRALSGTLAIAGLAALFAACDPPPPQYPQYRYGSDPAAQDPNAMPQPPVAQPTAYPSNGDPNAPPPPPGYTSTAPQPGYGPAAPQPGYTSTAVQAPTPGYTTTNGDPAPPGGGGYTSTATQPGYAPAPGGPSPVGPAPAQGPAPLAPAPGPPYPTGPAPLPASGSIANGQYMCWQMGVGGYVASNLGSVNLNPDGTYQVAGYNGAGGSYRADTVAVYFNGGPLNGWVAAVGANAKGPLVRFRPDIPSNPGREMHQGDHLCFLHF